MQNRFQPLWALLLRLPDPPFTFSEAAEDVPRISGTRARFRSGRDLQSGKAPTSTLIAQVQLACRRSYRMTRQSVFKRVVVEVEEGPIRSVDQII